MLERTAEPGTAELQHCRAAAGTAGELLFLSLNLHPGNARGVVRFDREQLLLGQIGLVKEKKKKIERDKESKKERKEKKGEKKEGTKNK